MIEGMYRNVVKRSTFVLLVLFAGCAPRPVPPASPVPPAPPPAEPVLPPLPAAGLPDVPAVEGTLAIRVVHPTPETPRPNVDSAFIYGSVGTGAARLSINGQPVEVHPNGAFLAFLRTPRDGRWELVAEAHDQTERATVAYRPPPSPPATPTAPPATVTFPAPRVGTVTGGADTLATGSDVAIGRPTPTGTYRWFLPRGARITVTGQRGDLLRVRLDTATAWVPAAMVSLGEPLPASPPVAPAPISPAAIIPAAEWVDVVFAADFSPFLIRPDTNRLVVTLYDRVPPPGSGPAADLVAGITYRRTAPAEAEIRLSQRLWGYTAFYGPTGDLVLRLRRPPNFDVRDPLRGLRIVVDPGHPPAGATGPTGLTEAEANLAIALPLAELLRQRGAEVTLTRTAHVPVSLVDRIELANRVDAHLLVSVHNNAFPEGVNPFRRHGTSTYYFHAHAAPLARALQREIQAVTQIPNLGALTGNLALVRPTWMPAVLTESLFMALPQQEAALRHPGFARRLAEAHVRGIEAFVREF